MSDGKNFERASKNWRNRSSSRSYFLTTDEFSPAVLRSIRKSSMAFAMVFRVSSMTSGLPPALKLSSNSRFFSSACAHDRVFAERRYCLPSNVHRKCLRQSHRRHVSSSAYLQFGVCRTNIEMLGITVPPPLLNQTVAQD